MKYLATIATCVDVSALQSCNKWRIVEVYSPAVGIFNSRGVLGIFNSCDVIGVFNSHGALDVFKSLDVFGIFNSRSALGVFNSRDV